MLVLLGCAGLVLWLLTVFLTPDEHNWRERAKWWLLCMAIVIISSLIYQALRGTL